MMSLALVWLAGASGFVLPAQPALPRPGPAAAAAAATAAAAAASAPTVLRPHAAPPRAAPGAVQMGLFGLGYPELAVIGLVGIVLLGPERLVPMARDLGKSASGLKEVSDSFAQGMAEGEVGLANEKKLDGMKTAEPQAEAKADAPKSDDQKQA